MTRKSTMLVFVLLVMVALSSTVLAQEPIRLGLIGPRTGGFASFGIFQVEGVTMALEEAGYSVAGRSIELFSEDSAGNVEQLVTRLRALDERDNVHVILGPSLGSEGGAAVDWAKDNDIPMVIIYSAPEDITMRSALPHVVRAGWTGAQPMFALGEYAAKELGYRKIVTISQDYSFPYNQVGGFMKGFFLNGGEEVTRIWHPVDTADFSSIFARVPQDVDAALVVSGGADVIPFIQQWFDFGMDQMLPLLAGSNVPDSTVLPELGDDALGLISALQYAEGLQSENFVNWKNAYVQRWGRMPAAVAEHAYVATKMVLAAIAAVDGDVEDTDAFLAELRATNMPDAPRGPFHLDEYGNPVQNIYIREVRRVDGELVNVPIKTIEGVSQFGPFHDNPELYLAQPEDSRDFPPGTLEEFKALFPDYF